VERTNPFKGLAYYERADAAHFAGRQRDIDAVINGILRTRTFVLYGRSGLGKTSLLLAGVFPRLADQGCLTLGVRLLEDPLGDLRRALALKAGEGTEASETASLATLIERAGRSRDGKDRLVVIAFDQFEEFFVRFADQPDPAGGVRSGEELDRKVRQQRIAQRQAFIQEIGRLAADARLNLRLVFSLREDWIAEMGDFADAVPEITHHMYRLLPLTSFGVRQSIVETLRSSASTEFDSRLVSALVDALADVNFDPIVLQVLCSEVWERARLRGAEGEPVRLELADLEAIGGVRQVFRGYLDKVNGEIDPKDLRRKILTGAVFEALISEKRTKLAVSREFLLEQSFLCTGEELDEVLDRLCRHRLVRSDPRGGVRWFELVHERLVGAVLEWFETDLEFFRFRSARNLVLNSCRNRGWRENPELLLTRGQIDDTVGPFKGLLRFNEEERLFLVSSAIYSHSRDLEYWAELAGDDTSADLIERFLTQQQNERLRQRAAEAASRVAERPEHFARLCLDLALRDPSPGVRQEAARSFADLASPREFQALAERLREPQNRNAALDVLTEVADKEKVPEDVKLLGRGHLREAWRRLYRRRLEAGRQEIRKLGIGGAKAGFTAAVLWSLTAGLLLMRIWIYEIQPEEAMSSPWIWPGSTGIYLLFALVLGTFAGWRAARRAARERLCRHKGPSIPGMAGKVVPGICLAVLGLWLVAFLWPDTDPIRPSPWEEFFYFFSFVAAPLFGLLFGSAVLMTAALPVFQPGERRRNPFWLWAWTWAFGGSLLLLGLVFLVKSDSESLLLKAVVATSLLAGGLFTYCGLLAVAFSVPASNQLIPARSRQVRKVLGVLLALLSGTILISAVGWDGLPFLARRENLGAADILLTSSRPLGALHFQLSAPKGQGAPRLAEFTFQPPGKLMSFGQPNLGSGEVLALRPGEDQRLAFETKGGGAVLVRPDRPLSGRLPLQGSQPVVVRLAGKDGTWTGRIPGHGVFGQGQRLFLGIGEAAFGEERCRKAGFTLQITGGDVESSEIGLACDPQAQQITFSEIPWPARAAAPILTLRAWKRADLATGVSTWARFMPDGKHVITHSLGVEGLDSGKMTQTLSLWSLDGSRSSLRVSGPENPSATAELSPDGQWIAAISGDRASLSRADGAGPTIPLPHGRSVTRLAFSPDGAYLATVDEENLVKIWRADSSGTLVAELPHRGDPESSYDGILSIAFSRDGSRLATGGNGGIARLWNLGDKSPPREIDLNKVSGMTFGHPAEAAIFSLAFSPDGARLVLACSEGLALWNIGSVPEITVLLPHPSVTQAVFNPDASRVLVVSGDGLGEIWKLDGSRIEKVAALTSNGITYAVFSPDGSRVATASADRRARIWSSDGSGPVVLPHDSPIQHVELNRGGTHLLTVLEDGPTRIWDISSPLRPRELGDVFVFLRVSPASLEPTF
jgi:WD40 repeat protein